MIGIRQAACCSVVIEIKCDKLHYVLGKRIPKGTLLIPDDVFIRHFTDFATSFAREEYTERVYLLLISPPRFVNTKKDFPKLSSFHYTAWGCHEFQDTKHKGHLMEAFS